MQPSMFNVQVPVADGSEVFPMNTFSDAQLLVSSDVTRLMERVSRFLEGREGDPVSGRAIRDGSPASTRREPWRWNA